MTGRIPQDFIADLIDRADLVQVVGSRVQLRKAGREYKACCPFHGEKTPSFTVSPEKGFYHCFGCGAHGNAIGFLMEHDHLDFVTAVEELAAILGVDVPREEQTGGPPSPTAALHTVLERATELYREQLQAHPRAIDYLKKRGLDSDTATRFQIGYAPAGWDFLLQALGSSEAARANLLQAGLLIRNDEGRLYDRFRDRIMFPIRDSRGRTVGFGGRVLDQGEPKYLNSPETPVFHKGRELYGLLETRRANRTLERLLVVEGYMDVVALSRHGIHNAVATLGTATTPEHLRRLFSLVSEVVFCFDGDRAGRDAAWRALQVTLPELRDGRQVRFLFLDEGDDPDSFVQQHGAVEFNARVATSQPLSDYLIAHLKGDTDAGHVDGLARLAELARPHLQRIPEGIYRALLLEKLAAEIGLSATRLEQLLQGDAGKQAGRRQPVSPPRSEISPPGPGSLVRRAVWLVLHRPAAALPVSVPPELEDLHTPGVLLLTELLHSAREQPGIKPVRLAGEFASHPDGGAHLYRLLSDTGAVPLAPDSDWAAELQATLNRIVRQELERRLTQLTEKSHQGLNAEEKQEFRALQRRLAAH